MVAVLIVLAGIAGLIAAAAGWAVLGRRRPPEPVDLRRADAATAVTPEEAARNAADSSAWMLGGDGGG